MKERAEEEQRKEQRERDKQTPRGAISGP